MTSRRLASIAAFCALLASCTGGSTTSTTPASSVSSTTTDSPIPSGPIAFVPGEFFVDWADVRSDFTWTGGTGSLHVTNDSTTPVGPPGLYAVTDASTTVDATVTPAEGVDPGAEQMFQVVFPDSLEPAQAGLLVLSFGDESWGDMAPVVAP